VRVTPAPAKVLASRTEREYSIGATEAAVGIVLARAAASVTGLAGMIRAAVGIESPPRLGYCE